MGFFRKQTNAEPKVRLVKSNDQRMELAYQLATNTLPTAIEALSSGAIDALFIKTRFGEGDTIEQPWISVTAVMKDCFSGTLSNDLQYCASPKRGDSVVVSFVDVTDWLFMMSGKMVGNYTLRAMLPDMPPEERAKKQSMLMPQPTDADLWK